MNELRIYLVDDNPDFLRIAARLIDAMPGARVVGSAGSGRDALERIPATHPDVVFLDVSMPDLSGIAVARLLKRLASPPRIVMLSMHDLRAYRAAAREAGADGYILKMDAVRELPRVLAALFASASDHSNVPSL